MTELAIKKLKQIKYDNLNSNGETSQARGRLTSSSAVIYSEQRSAAASVVTSSDDSDFVTKSKRNAHEWLLQPAQPRLVRSIIFTL